MTESPTATATSIGVGELHFRVIEDVRSLEQLDEDILSQWDALCLSDPSASPFQTPHWCLPWYQAYKDAFAPRLIIAVRGSRLTGVAALAEERQTHRLTWAGDRMADYRDVVSTVDDRAAIVGEALAYHRRHPHLSDPFIIGCTQPESPTVSLVSQLAGPRSTVARTHACYRIPLNDTTVSASLLKKKWIRRHLNGLRRQGTLQLTHVQDSALWESTRSIFFAHHTLRQLTAGREVSFLDRRKQAFFDQLFREQAIGHYSILTLDDRPIAEHFGFSWNGTLYLGAPAFDITMHRRAPAQLLLAQLADVIEKEGYSCLDLTIGESVFKARMGQIRVELPSVEVYRHTGRLVRRQAKKLLADTAKRVLPASWLLRLKPHTHTQASSQTLAEGVAAVLGPSPSWHTLTVPAHLTTEHIRRSDLVHLLADGATPEVAQIARGLMTLAAKGGSVVTVPRQAGFAVVLPVDQMHSSLKGYDCMVLVSQEKAEASLAWAVSLGKVPCGHHETCHRVVGVVSDLDLTAALGPATVPPQLDEDK